MSNTIAYGARCTWWEDKKKVGLKDSGLPCCPFCGGVLFEIEVRRWWDQVDAFSVPEVENYRDMIEWSRGRCFNNMDRMIQVYKIEVTQ